MLIEFRVENHRSLRDEQVLSLEPAAADEDRGPLPVAALYGANGSGKSNVLAALHFMREAVVDSARTWVPGGPIPRDPFAWGPRRAEPSFFEVALLLEGVRYQYGFTATDAIIAEEWLHAWPRGKKQIWFERDGDAFKFGEHLKGRNADIEGMTRPNALFLSVAAQFRHEQILPVFGWFAAQKVASSPIWRRPPLYAFAELFYPFMPKSGFGDEGVRQMVDEAGETEISARDWPREPFRSLFLGADLGIVDARVEKYAGLEPGALRRSRILLRHESSEQDAWLPLEQESGGTQVMFRLASWVAWAIERGTLLAVDELESGLHPALARRIVALFRDPATNPRNAQLIFTTHDANLLGNVPGEPALAREHIWLTEKDGEGTTRLYPLTDFKPRKDENLERGYLLGRYGAVPFLGAYTSVEE